MSKHQLSLVGVTLTSGLLRLAKALAHNECRFRATENASGNTWNISRDGTSHGGKCKTMSRYLVTNLMPGRLKLTPNITACLATQIIVFIHRSAMEQRAHILSTTLMTTSTLTYQHLHLGNFGSPIFEHT